MALRRLKPKTGQAGLYILLLAIIIAMMGLLRWLPGKMSRPIIATSGYTIAIVSNPDIIFVDSSGLKGPGIRMAEQMESISKKKVRIVQVADNTSALMALLKGNADIAGPMLPYDIDSVAFSDVAVWKEYAVSDESATRHPAALRTISDSVTIGLRWAVRRNDTTLLRTVNNILD